MKNLVGISEPYEPPLHPEVIVDTSKASVDQAVEHILSQLVAQRMIDPTLAAMKSRPKVSARAKVVPAPAPVAPVPPRAAPAHAPARARPAKKARARKPTKARPVKLHKKAAPKHRAAARTARVPHRAAAGKRRR